MSDPRYLSTWYVARAAVVRIRVYLHDGMRTRCCHTLRTPHFHTSYHHCAAAPLQPRAKRELRQASIDLSERCLYHAAKWAAEFVVELEDVESEDDGSDSKAAPATAARATAAGPAMSREEEDAVRLAKTYFDLREYRRAAHVLGTCTSQKAIFLRLYSLYLAGEKGRVQEAQQKSEPLAKAKVVNKELTKIEQELRGGFERKKLDPFNTYLYGLVLKKLDRVEPALRALCRSVNAYPLNYSAWKCLSGLIMAKSTIPKLDLRESFAKRIFMVEVHLELHDQKKEELLSEIEGLQDALPGSSFLFAQEANAYYNFRDFDKAQELFQDLRETDPLRLDGMDVYSNILYVKDAIAELSLLAHEAMKTDKYRPETCCIVGNYYSAKRQHAQAIVYFRRALRLDPNYLSAWTLMGHEYVELRNSAAAVDAYRRAVDINPRDYRAWYGLGQAYEMKRLHSYALYYFRKASKLRPYDSRMWHATGACYTKLGRLEDAIKCYKRAAALDETEARPTDAHRELAESYKKLGDLDSAATYYRRWLESKEQLEGGEVQLDDADALLFLAQYTKARGDLEKSEEYCTRALDLGGSPADKAKSILEEIQEIRRHSSSVTPARGDSKASTT